MNLVVGTQSGARYAVTDYTITHIQPGEWEGNPNVLRRDGEAIQVQRWVQVPLIGTSMAMLLEPLGEGVATLRVTTPVVWIRTYLEGVVM